MKRSGLLLAKIAVSLILLGYLASKIDLTSIQARIRSADTLFLAAAVGLYGMMLLLSTWRWRLLLHALGYPVPLFRLSSSYLVASFFNNFLPSNIGGDIVRVRDSARLTGSSTTTSLAVVAVDRILGFCALYFLALGAYFLGADFRHLAYARTMLILIGVVCSLLAYLFFMPGTARRIVAALRIDSFPWLKERFEVIQAAIQVYRQELKMVSLAFAASVLLQSSVVLYFWAVAHALQIPLPAVACFLMVPLNTLIQMVPVSLNGWGIRESVYTVYFSQIGLSRESAFAFSVVGAGLVVLLSLSGAVVWASRGRGDDEAAPGDA